MSSIIAFRAEHLKHLLSQELNKHERGLFTEDFILSMETNHQYITLIYKDKIMACGGITPYWPGRGEVWTIFSEESKYNFVATFRMIRWWLHQQLKLNYRRVELSIPPDNLNARRRSELLGFKLEVERARKYLPTGEDCSLYSLVRG